MINMQYKLLAPRVINTSFSDIQITNENLVIRPEMLSICKADMRYYYGIRDLKILKSKLPMALIHEAVGSVLIDRSGRFQKGDKVVLLPNIPGKCSLYAENYRVDSLFSSSSADGFMQEVVSLPMERVIGYDGIHMEVASFIEFVSVGVHAVKSYLARKNEYAQSIAVWGDGALGYVVCLMLKFYCPTMHISIIGSHRRKLEIFKFVDKIYTVDEVIEKNLTFDDAIECVGGESSETAVASIIDAIRPEGLIVLLGVSEKAISISTRMILEKGLTIIGRSRSSKSDFQEAIDILSRNQKIVTKLKKIVSETIMINEVKDIHYAFERARTSDFKIVMKWNV